MVKHFCDRCRREITGNRRVIVHMETLNFYDDETVIDGLVGIEKETELCPRCASMVFSFMMNERP